ncbi:10419_t:CDS:1, partial [Cetraspora pellucida]
PKYNGSDVSKCNDSDISECEGPDSPEQDGPKCISFGCGSSEYNCLECNKFIFNESFKVD